MSEPKYTAGQRVVANQHSLNELVGHVGTIHHCKPMFDIIGPGFQRYPGWWYHVVFDDPALQVSDFAWICAEFTLDPIDGKGDWDTIEKLVNWNPTKELVH